MTYEERIEYAVNPTAKRLFEIMEEKKSNLCFTPDVTKVADLLKFADEIGPYICLLKTHVDLLEDFSYEFTKDLLSIAKKHNFMIFEDRKFADIGAISGKQYQYGIYKISDWSDITNAHIVPGPGIIEGLKQVGLPKGRGLLLLAEMSSSGTMAKGEYTQTAVAYAKEHKDFVIGFISMGKLTDDPAFIHMTPGVKKQKGTDALGQQYKTVESVILENGSDIIIVGRGIYAAEDPKKEAADYQSLGYNAYLKRLASRD
ncbi:orotidine-5'-phosphate decarboxylase [Candidatus Aerophobetes bacterium]|uniref:orotidine-5'-phosphate decarboxylase n=2 Tax=Aerophobetes bacterium TaxID=2030807 RepID=A0A2A4YED8_UNCAE|nr:MAG: orotidine-5'-phosphate decarboxylase [Candidatus Aerophobetes bacterium]